MPTVWRHYAITRDAAGALRLYRDGVLDASAGGFTLPFHVGYLGSSPAGGTGARFDDVRIWSVARSAAEIAGALSEYIEPTTPGLERLYTFDEGAGEVIDTTTGAVAAAYTYDSFGARTQHAGSLFQFYGYTGREEDPESGLTYYRARYYDPGSGAFVGADPIGFAAGSINLDAYVSNDPFGYSDPSGLRAKALTADQVNLLVLMSGGAMTTGAAVTQVYGGMIEGPLDGIFDGFSAAIAMMKSSDGDGSAAGSQDSGGGNHCGPNGPDDGWWKKVKMNLAALVMELAQAAGWAQGVVAPTQDMENIPMISPEDRLWKMDEWFDSAKELDDLYENAPDGREDYDCN